jgi:transcriptional regulator with XRE-family HTH domain
MTPSELLAWRKDMQYTQEDAAAAIGMSPSNYKDLEGGKRRATGKQIEVIDKRTEYACLYLKQICNRL